MSATELAKIVDIPATTYRNYENTDRQPPFIVLVAISRALKVSVDYLLGISNIRQGYSDVLSEHDLMVIKAYNSKPEMQPAIDKLLGLKAVPKGQLPKRADAEMEIASDIFQHAEADYVKSVDQSVTDDNRRR